MEGVLCKISSADVQKESVNLSVDREDSKMRLSSKDLSVDKNLALEESKRVKVYVENGAQPFINGESPSVTEPAAPKTYSPTLIGSAIQAVKNLFSPDKTKGKPVNVLSPIKQQSAAGSPRSSIYIPGKIDIFSSEPVTEILINNIQPASGENNPKNHLQNTELGDIQSAVNFDSPNNADDSFLTTVSLIEDSFHSAVTHLDGEVFKNVTNFMEGILNNSQNLDLTDPYNDTLENNESYLLESTTLKLGNFISEGNNISILDADGSEENLNSGNGKVQIPITEENAQNGSTHLGRSMEGNPHQSPTVPPEKLKDVEMSHLFLNKSFEKPAHPQQSNSEFESNNKKVENESETKFEVPNEVEVEQNISTTTVVLNSVDLDILSTHKADDLEAHIPSSDFFEVCSSFEDDLARKPTELHNREHNIQFTDSSSSPLTTFYSPCQEKDHLSEKNSPNQGVNPNKIKLNKSDELISHRNETPEGKRKFQENNSSVDISLMKNSEASEMTNTSFTKVTKGNESEISNRESPTDASHPVTVFSQQSYTILTHDNSLNRPVIEPLNVSKDLTDKETFQTIQTEGTLNKSLGKYCKNTSFSAEDLKSSSEVKQSTPIWEGNNENGQKFFRPTSLKLNSPDGKKNICGEPDENISRQPYPMEISPVNPDDHVLSAGNDMNGTCYSGSFDPNTTRVLQSKELKGPEDPSDMLAVHNLNQTFDEKQGPKHVTDKLDQTFLKKSISPETSKQTDGTGHRLNQTFDKITPKSKNMNSTFTKKWESGEMEKSNQTFDISASSEAHLNKTYDKPQMNETFDKKSELSLLNKTQILEPSIRNQTFVNEIDNDCQNLNKTFDKNELGEGNTLCKGNGATDTSNRHTADKNESANKDENESFGSGKSSNTSIPGSDHSTVVLNEELQGNQSMDDLSEKLEKLVLEGNEETPFPGTSVAEGISLDLQMEDKLLSSLKEGKLGCNPDLVQLIQEQFSPNDIEKICNVVQDFSSVKLSNDIMRASEQFDKSFHGSLTEAEFKPPEEVFKPEKPVTALSPQSFDFLNSIRGKPTGRDLSRESLYVKFDPLVQPAANSLIDFTKEGEAMTANDSASPTSPHSTSICEQLLAISPEKKPDAIVPPLTPLSHKVKTDLDEEKTEKLKELQNEIYFLKNLYAERERTNKAKMEDWESQIAKLTSENCFLEDKVKESKEREKSLVKKMKEQNDSIVQLKIIMEGYVKVISKLTGELETLRNENTKQLENLSQEKDSYVTHLQNTEAAFTDVHIKYEKSKRTIVSLKANEAIYRNTLAEQAQKLEEFKSSAKKAKEKALMELQKMQEELSETKANHTQETTRLRAQLRKTELKVEDLQESLDQKIKQNQQLTAICDDLIEGKK